MKLRSLVIALFSLVLTQLSACIGTQTFSNTARNGDTIVVAMGQTSGADFINPDDLTVQVVDQFGTAHAASLRTLSRVYPDPTSGAVLVDDNFFGTHIHYDGEWMAIIDLVTPLTTTPTSIPAGPATVELLHPTQTFYAPSITIQSGTGKPHPLASTNSFGFGASEYLKPSPHIVVRTQGTPTAPVAAATFVIHYNPAVFPTLDGLLFRVTRFSTDPNIQLITGSKSLPGGMEELTVIVMNPNGFDGATLSDFATGRKSKLADLSFVMTWATEPTASSFVPTVPADISLVDAQFVDLDGDPVGGVVADLGGGYGYLGM